MKKINFKTQWLKVLLLFVALIGYSVPKALAWDNNALQQIVLTGNNICAEDGSSSLNFSTSGIAGEMDGSTKIIYFKALSTTPEFKLYQNWGNGYQWLGNNGTYDMSSYSGNNWSLSNRDGNVKVTNVTVGSIYKMTLSYSNDGSTLYFNIVLKEDAGATYDASTMAKLTGWPIGATQGSNLDWSLNDCPTFSDCETTFYSTSSGDAYITLVDNSGKYWGNDSNPAIDLSSGTGSVSSITKSGNSKVQIKLTSVEKDTPYKAVVSADANGYILTITKVVAVDPDPTYDYTVYYNNGETAWENVYAYVWEDGTHNNFGAWPGTQLTTKDDRGYYKYEIKGTTYTEGQLKIQFNDGSAKTDDLAFANNKVYGGDAAAHVPANFYIAYNLGDGDGWSFGHALTEASATTMTANFVITGTNGYVCFSRDEATGWGDSFGIRYGAESSDFVPTNGVSTTIKANNENCWKLPKGTWTATVTFENEVPVSVVFTKEVVAMGTVYMNFGHDYLSYAKDGAKVYVKLNGEAEGHEMTLTNPNEYCYKYDIPDSYSSISNINFCFTDKWDNTKTYQMGSDWDTEHPIDYIFSADYANDPYGSEPLGYSVAIARQSIITYAQARSVRDGGIKKLYLTGQNITASDYSLAENAGEKALGWAPKYPYAITADDDVFFFTVDFSGEAKFKISYLNPLDWATANGVAAGDLTAKRAWATYNMALIGVDTKQSSLLEAGALTDSGTEGTNGNVKPSVLRSIPFNYYNQYDWYLDGSFSNVGDLGGKGYIVVDTHEECQSVSLVNFDPMPEATFTNAVISKEFIGYDNGFTMHESGLSDHFNAASDNGPVYVRYVNVASATVTIDAADDKAVKDGGFTVKYDIMQNGKVVKTIEGVPSALDLSYIALDHQSQIQVRANYTSTATNLHFHSRTASENVSVDAQFYKPSVTAGKSVYYWGGVTPEGQHQINAAIMVDYSKSTTARACYADYKVVMSGEEMSAPIMTTSDDVVNNVTGIEGLGKNIDDYDWNPSWNTVTAEDYTPDNNWAALIREDGQLPISVQGVEYQDVFSKDVPSKQVTVQVYGVYPFLVQKNPVVSAATSSRRRAESALEVDYNNYKIVNVEVPADPLTVTIPTSNEISGIYGAPVVDTTDGEGEYYNLQGVRVEGSLAPGIYIHRQGNTATKVYIK